ncbi:MAG: prepilin-type N-terminal cleavage/methylation domain-containing protein [Nitrospirota bacterium]
MTGIGKRSGKRLESQRGLPAGRGQAGFTLLEVMIALSILVVTFVVLLGLLNRDILQHQEARYLTRATLLAQQKISEVEMADFPALGILSGTFPEPDETFDWAQTVLSTPFDYAREVRMDVGWKDGEHRNSVALVTFVMEEK